MSSSAQFQPAPLGGFGSGFGLAAAAAGATTAASTASTTNGEVMMDLAFPTLSYRLRRAAVADARVDNPAWQRSRAVAFYAFRTIVPFNVLEFCHWQCRAIRTVRGRGGRAQHKVTFPASAAV